MISLIKQCILVDKTHPLHLKHVNILVEDDRIKDIREEDICCYDRVIEGNSMYVSPGWIDIHTHCFQDTTDLGIEADRIGVSTGVVCILDAGSSGSDTIDAFYEQVKDKKTIVKAWLNIAKTGLIDRHELKDPENINLEDSIRKMEIYADFIVGIKVRASGSVMGDDTITPFKKAQHVSERTKKPIMVHFGNNPPTIEEVLEQMRENDVLTHCFHGKPNNIMEEDKIKQSVLHKRDAGIFYDVGHGQDSFSYSIAKKAMKADFYPDSISTDLHKYNVDTPVGTLAHVMTKFLHLGYDLEEIIHLVTQGPAKIAGLQDLGYVSAGRKAHLSFFDLVDVNEELVDSMHKIIPINRRIIPVACMINGEYIEVSR